MCDKIIKFNLYILLLLFSGITSVSNAEVQENPEVKAIRLFNSGEYSQSEAILEGLLQKKADSPILNYYYGASRTENGYFGEKELNCLNKAGKDMTPDRLYYYLAIQHHARGNWDQALKMYNQFKVSVPEREQKELELDNKIQLCYNQVNPFDVKETGQAAQINDSIPEMSSALKEEKPADLFISEEESVMFSASADPEDILSELENGKQETTNDLFLPREALPNLPGVKPTIPDGEPVHFQVNNTITYLYTSQFRTEEGKRLFDKARDLEQRQGKNIEKAENLREAYKNLQSQEEREAVAGTIISLENESLHLEEEIRQSYLQSCMAENQYWEIADPVARNNFMMEQEKLLAGLKEENAAPKETSEEILIELFEPAPVKKAKAPPSELVYKIQIGAYSKGVPAYKQRLFKKLSVIRTIDNYTDEKGVVVYTTGKLSRYEDALIMRNQVRQEGIQDASVVPYYNGKRISLEEAKKLEENNDI